MAAVEKLRATHPAAVDSCTVAMGLSLGKMLSSAAIGSF
jgi:hypothetical protein